MPKHAPIAVTDGHTARIEALELLPPGSQGPQGEPGLDGEDGAQGIQGETGPQGEQGQNLKGYKVENCGERVEVVEAGSLSLRGRIRLLGHVFCVGRSRPITVHVACADGTHDAITATRITRKVTQSDGATWLVTSFRAAPRTEGGR